MEQKRVPKNVTESCAAELKDTHVKENQLTSSGRPRKSSEVFSTSGRETSTGKSGSVLILVVSVVVLKSEHKLFWHLNFGKTEFNRTLIRLINFDVKCW